MAGRKDRFPWMIALGGCGSVVAVLGAWLGGGSDLLLAATNGFLAGTLAAVALGTGVSLFSAWQRRTLDLTWPLVAVVLVLVFWWLSSAGNVQELFAEHAALLD